ncbi:hypothetical protein [Streptomyces anulatus]|uniref:hypothetical protein n=1 Tax=Streptomyces anulatus TaxID=1892 RepID=UPI001D187595|nr:hypothetical protein [Streptomyces anulatus]
MPKSTKHAGRAQVVTGGSATETQVLFFTEAEAHEWASTGKTTAAEPQHPGPPVLHEPAPLAGSPPPDAWSSDAALPPIAPDLAPAAGPVAVPATSPADPVPDDGDQAVGLRRAAEHHLPGITLDALCFARAKDTTFPAPAAKRGTELLYSVHDLKRWARNRPRAPTGTTDLD